MKPADLQREAEAAAQALAPMIGHLPSIGISFDAIARLGQKQPPVGTVLAQWRKCGMWEPDEGGDRMLVVPVGVQSGFFRWGIWVDTTDIIDLIAFRSQQSSRWAWRTGIAWALGEELLEDKGEPVPIVSTPLSWLAAAGQAVCILDWSKTSPAWAALRNGPALICESDHLLRRLHRGMMASVRLPNLTLNREEERNAA